MAKKRKEPAGTFFIVSSSRAAKKRAFVHVDSVSSDGRRLHRETTTVYTAIQPSHARRGRPLVEDVPEYPSDQAWVDEDPVPEIGEGGNAEVPPSTGSQAPTFVTVTHDPVLLKWTEHRDSFLNELLRLEGLRGARIPRCRYCGTNDEACYTCIDCFGGDNKWECSDCCLEHHAASPFHRIKVWNGRFCERTTLKDMGLHIQLGHAHGDVCPCPTPAPSDFVVLHTNGLHPMKVFFCNCDRMHLSGDRCQQLLCFELFPATLKSPTTCCTLRLLEEFHILTLQSKINAYDFYLSLVKMTDNTGTVLRYHRLKAFLRIVREYRHLKMLKRAGRGHEEGGVDATPQGGLAVLCPGCPRPGVNLPADWMNIPRDRRYIYRRFTAQDASFKHKRRAVSNEDRDPALGSGLGYFVEDTAYRAHLARFVNEDEISTCTGLAALLHANTRWMKGYATTGIALVCCARHGFVLPNAVGDLQKGERYCNMDYIFCSQARHVPKEVEEVNSYDIMCQWEKKLRQRIEGLPDDVKIDLTKRKFAWLIPKYHWRAHKEEGHNVYSFYVRWGVGNTDGEEIERLWWSQDATAGSTREMGPGSRHDTLEDHFSWRNWQKLVGLGVLLKKRLKKAKAEYLEHFSELDDYTTEVGLVNVENWTAEVEAWEEDQTLTDPYFIPPSGMTEGEVRLELAKEDNERIAKGELSLHEVTPSSMLTALLDLEDQQRHFQVLHPRSQSGPPLHTAAVIEQRTKLRHRIAKVAEIQAIYMPGVPALRAEWEQELRRTSKEDLAEDLPLFFPSAVQGKTTEPCAAELLDVERRLREAQLRSSLDRLRIQLHVKTRLSRNKKTNIRGQKANTRANARLQANENRIRELSDRYRAGWKAKHLLDGDGPWQREWQVLKPEDVRGLQDVPIDPKTHLPSTTARWTMSWIWMSAGREGNESATIPGMQEVLRVQWLRTRARTMRCEEEINILTEEQRRVLATLEHDATVWDEREEKALGDIYVPHRQGAAAYAAEQAANCRRIKAKFAAMWSLELADDEEDVDENNSRDDDECEDNGANSSEYYGEEIGRTEVEYQYADPNEDGDALSGYGLDRAREDFVDDYTAY